MTNSAIRCAFALAALLCVASAADAQGWEGGIKTGISRGGFPETDEFKWDRGFPSSAAFVKRSFYGPFSIQAEAAHVRRIGVSEIGGSTLTLTSDYLELPLILQVRLASAMGIAPFLSAGPSVILRLRCRLQFVGGGLVTNDDCDVASGERSNPFDFGVAGGGGLNVHLGAITLLAEARASTGLRTHALPVALERARNVGWSVLAGVSMPLQNPRMMPPVRLPPLAVLPDPMPPAGIQPAPTLAEPSDVLAPEARRVSITAANVDVRELLREIAQATGLNIIVSSQIRERVSLTLNRVPAAEAVQAIVAVAGLSLSRPSAPGQATIVFRQPAVNVNEAPADRIATRFGVSSEMAKWIVDSRAPEAKKP